jgi:hypothetical protein
MGGREQDRCSSELCETIAWVAGLGGASAEALARRRGIGVASARARLSLAERRGLLGVWRPLREQAALYSVTRAGLRAAGVSGLEPARISAAGARHVLLCSLVAAELACRYPGRAVIGEPELRREERAAGRPLASLPPGRAGESTHRPDLVLAQPGGGPPIAVEVELTVKSPRRLAAICRAWARSRHVGGVLYVAPEPVRPALGRAIETAGAGRRIVVIELEGLEPGECPTGAIARAIAGAA